MEPSPLKAFLKRNERRLTLLALLAGFIVDNLTLTRVDLLFDNILLLSYLALATVSIFFLNILKDGKIRRILPYTLQYAFGALFSAYIIFYSQSATLIGNWPFLLLLVVFFFGNEYLKSRYQRTIFQMSILFIAIFSFLIFSLPVLIGAVGPIVFIGSGLISIGAIFALIALLRTITSEVYPRLRLSVILIYLVFHLLYFTNIIPPVPLALTELSIHHNVERTTRGNYIVYSEHQPWYAFIRPERYSYRSGDTLSSFSAVFAPTRIDTTVIHEWSYFDTEGDEWIVTNTISFPISGGREGGYRGYTSTSNLTAGKWRVEVLTAQDQLLGRKTFTLVASDERPQLSATRR